MTGPLSPGLRRFSDLTFRPRQLEPEMAELAEIVGPSDGTSLGAGFARLHNAKINWTVSYDEVLTVIEGAVRVYVADECFEAYPMDSIWLPNGSAVIYEAEKALVYYAILPTSYASEKVEKECSR